MRPVSQVLGEYAAYHQHPLNRMSHYFGIPLIVFSMLLILSIPHFSLAYVNISAADVLFLLTILWYLRLDTLPGLLSATLLLPVYLLAVLAASSLSGSLVNVIFAFTFIAGWTLQLLGHRIERRRPALEDNFMQVFCSPLFFVSELIFKLGYHQSLALKVNKIAQQKTLEITIKANRL